MRAASSRQWSSGTVGVGLASLGLVLGLVGCELEKPDAGPLIGPSTPVMQVSLVARPDTVNADGVTESVVTLELHDQDGAPAAGRAILFQLLSGDGSIREAPGSTFVGPVQTGLVMATGSDGSAVVVYQAGFNFTTATIGVRPYGFDSTNTTNFLRTVEIIQR